MKTGKREKRHRREKNHAAGWGVLFLLTLRLLLIGCPLQARPFLPTAPDTHASATPEATALPHGAASTSTTRSAAEGAEASENPLTTRSRLTAAAQPSPRRALHPLDTLAALRSDIVARDSLDYAPSERTDRLYDSLRTKAHRRAVPRLLYRMLIRRPARDTTSTGLVVDESRALGRFAGTTVRSVAIERDNVFPSGESWLHRTANRLHRLTRERVIRRDLLLRPGDPFDPELVVLNKQLLRSRAYIADVDIDIKRNPFDTASVDLVVRTRDSWSIALDGAFHDRGRTQVELYDANLLGSGNLLRIKTHFDRSDFTYGGNIVAYEIPNLLGSFFTAGLSAGRDCFNSEMRLGLGKEFLRPTDYTAGIAYDNIKTEHRLTLPDTLLRLRARRLDIWAGYSHFLPSARSSFYAAGRYLRSRFGLRLPVAAGLNPAFHDSDLALFSAGLYRERFYTANMVHGFGTREYLATGYRAELTGGYAWGEFADELYVGFRVAAGGFRPGGYFMASLALGSFIDPRSGMWRRSGVDIDLGWFSDLYMVRRSRLRQFLSIDYTQGWNRLAGAGEAIRFTSDNGLHLLTDRRPGTTRAVLNTETVLFTPLQPLGFRIALFGFADFGTIGFSPNLFKNDFFTALGVGVRLRNERLVFSTVQIRLGVALGKGGVAGCDYFHITNSHALDEIRYRPSRPATVAFE